VHYKHSLEIDRCLCTGFGVGVGIHWFAYRETWLVSFRVLFYTASTACFRGLSEFGLVGWDRTWVLYTCILFIVALVVRWPVHSLQYIYRSVRSFGAIRCI
jgi:hypothetical protein